MDWLFDAHCHIAPDLTAPDAPDQEAPSGAETRTGVRGRLLCGTGPKDWDAVAGAALTWTGTVPAFGIHPWFQSAAIPRSIESLEQLLRRFPHSWMGEIGLDARRTGIASAERQEEVFAGQLRLARRLDRPVNLHCVAAYDRLTALLDAEYLGDGPRPFIIHSFAGPYQYIARLADRGALFTIGPLAWRRESRKARERAALIPEDRLLLESDAFLHPHRDAGEELRQSLRWLAECREVEAGQLAPRVASTVERIFSHA